MHSSDITDTLFNATDTSYLGEMARVAHALDLSCCDTTVFKLNDASGRAALVIDNIPASDEWRSLDEDLGRRCPVMQHCKRSPTPVAWNSTTYRRSDVISLYDVCSAVGLCSGVTVAMHLPHKGVLVQFSMHSDRNLPLPVLHALIPTLQLWGVSALSANEDLLLGRPHHAYQLTTVEVNALKLALCLTGLADIAAELGISIDLTDHVLRQAASKLNQSTARLAAIEAFHLGII
jgi:hypothetical protein